MKQIYFVFQYFSHVHHKNMFALLCHLCKPCSFWCLLQQHRMKQSRRIQDRYRITEMNAGVWQKFHKLLPPKAGGFQSPLHANIEVWGERWMAHK